MRFRKVKDPRLERSIWDSGWRLAVVVGSAVVLEVYLALYLALLLSMVGL